jgi:chromosome segregation ATPase
MTRSPDQRLDAVEDELETAKRLLVSAARYAESANLGLEQLTVKVDNLTAAQAQTQTQLLEHRAAQAQTQTQLDDLTAAQAQTQTQLDELTAAQTQTQAQLDQLTQKADQLSSRVDEFVFQATRLFAQQGERLIRVEGLTESLTGIVQRLDRNYQSQQSQIQEFQRTTNASLERIDRILDYLLREQRG